MLMFKKSFAAAYATVVVVTGMRPEKSASPNINAASAVPASSPPCQLSTIAPMAGDACALKAPALTSIAPPLTRTMTVVS
tara:strand:- start:18 stop:257 length:240 start_codon:yes stop_codon:yes gene_type:complete